MQKIQPEEIKDEEGDDSVSDGSSDHEDLEPMQVPTREAWVKEMGDYLADEEKQLTKNPYELLEDRIMKFMRKKMERGKKKQWSFSFKVDEHEEDLIKHIEIEQKDGKPEAWYDLHEIFYNSHNHKVTTIAIVNKRAQFIGKQSAKQFRSQIYSSYILIQKPPNWKKIKESKDLDEKGKQQSISGGKDEEKCGQVSEKSEEHVNKDKGRTVLYLSTDISNDYHYPTNLLQVGNLIFYFSLEQKYHDLEKKLNKQQNQRQFVEFTTSIWRSCCYNLKSDEKIDLPEFNIELGIERQNIYFIHKAVDKNQYALIYTEKRSPENLNVEIFSSYVQLLQDAFWRKDDEDTHELLLVDLFQRKPIQFVKEPGEQIMTLANEKGLIDCIHFVGHEENCSKSCYEAILKRQFVVLQWAIGLNHDYYETNAKEIQKKYELRSLCQKDKKLHSSDKRYYGVAILSELSLDQDTLQEKITVETHINETRQQHLYLAEENRIQFVKKLPDKLNSNPQNQYSTDHMEFLCQRQLTVRWEDIENRRVYYFYDEQWEIRLAFAEQMNQKQEEELYEKLRDKVGFFRNRSYDNKWDYRLKLHHCPSGQGQDIGWKFCIQKQYFLQKLLELERGGIRGIFNTKKITQLSFHFDQEDRKEVITYLIQEQTEKAYFNEQKKREKAFGTKMVCFLNGLMGEEDDEKRIGKLNAVNNEFFTSIDGSQIMRVDWDEKKVKKLKSQDDSDNKKVVFVDDAKGHYHRFEYDESFKYTFHNFDGEQFVFAFVLQRPQGTGEEKIYFVKKTLKDLEENKLKPIVLISPLSKNSAKGNSPRNASSNTLIDTKTPRDTQRESMEEQEKQQEQSLTFLSYSTGNKFGLTDDYSKAKKSWWRGRWYDHFQQHMVRTNKNHIIFIDKDEEDRRILVVLDSKLKSVTTQQILFGYLDFDDMKVTEIESTTIKDAVETTKYIVSTYATARRSNISEYHVHQTKDTIKIELTATWFVLQQGNIGYMIGAPLPILDQNTQNIDGAILSIGHSDGNDLKIALKLDFDCQHYTNGLVNFGRQKFFLDNADYGDTIHILSCRMTQKFIQTDQFTQAEKYQTLLTFMNIMMNELPFDLSSYLSYDLRAFIKGFEFSSMEVLFGGNVAENFLQDQEQSQEFMATTKKLDTITQLQQRLYPDTEDRDKDAEDLANFDYQFQSTLSKAFSLYCPSSTIGLIMQRLSTMKWRNKVREVILADLTKILSAEEVPKQFVNFLQGSNEKIEDQLMTSIQMPVEQWQKAPELSDQSVELITIYDVPVDKGTQELVVEKVQERYNKKKEENSDLSIRTRHQYIDFQFCTLKTKMDSTKIDDQGEIEVAEDYEKITHYLLSILTINLHSFEDLFLSKTILAIVELQNMMAIRFFQRIGIIFLLFFLVPIIVYNVASDLYGLGPYLLLSGLVVQIMIGILEYAQLQSTGGMVLYFKEDPWNITDFLGILVYAVYMSYEWHNGFNPNSEEKDLVHIILSLIMITLTLFKVLFFLRLSEMYGSLVQMLTSTAYELGSFTVFLFLMVIYFAIMQKLTNAKFNGGDYPLVMENIIYLLQTFRNLVGDISVPDYSTWTEKELEIDHWKKELIISIIWAIWFGNIFVNLIVMLNFLIAVISQTYDQAIAQQQFCFNRYRSDFNREYFSIIKYFFSLDEIKIFVVTEDLNKSYDFSSNPDVNLGFVNTIKRYLDKQTSDLNFTINKFDKQTSENMDKFRDELNHIKEELNKQIIKVFDKLEDHVNASSSGEPNRNEKNGQITASSDSHEMNKQIKERIEGMAFNVEKKQEAIREELRSHVNAVTKKQEELKHDIMNEIIEMRETCKQINSRMNEEMGSIKDMLFKLVSESARQGQE